MATEFKSSVLGISAALWACEFQARNTYNTIAAIRTEFNANVPDDTERMLREALLLSIEVERKLHEARAWIPQD